MSPENKKETTCPFWGECEEGTYCTNLELKNPKLCNKYWQFLIQKHGDDVVAEEVKNFTGKFVCLPKKKLKQKKNTNEP